ncbi:hypothetical protein [Sphingomonas gellani]|nr:hypothetical protein [Sphingomonas gellani]
MSLGATGRVPLLDRLVARWEISRLAVLPIVISFSSLWACLIGLGVIGKISGTKPVLAGRILVVIWIVLAGLELGRGLWTMRHRYASPRWLRGVNAAVGDEVVARNQIKRHA